MKIPAANCILEWQKAEMMGSRKTHLMIYLLEKRPPDELFDEKQPAEEDDELLLPKANRS